MKKIFEMILFLAILFLAFVASPLHAGTSFVTVPNDTLNATAGVKMGTQGLNWNFWFDAAFVGNATLQRSVNGTWHEVQDSTGATITVNGADPMGGFFEGVPGIEYRLFMSDYTSGKAHFWIGSGR